MQKSKTSLIDTENFQFAFPGMEKIMGVVIENFILDYPLIMEKIKSSIQSSDFKTLRVAARSLKDLLAAVYASDCMRLAQDLELFGKQENGLDVPLVFQRLEEKMKVLEHQLQVMKTNLPKTA